MDFSDILYQIKTQHQDKSSDLLLAVIDHIRPPKGRLYLAKDNLNTFKDGLKKDPELIVMFRSYLKALFDQKQYIQILSESGILTGKGFFPEAFERINTYFLPKVYDEMDVMAIFVSVFHKKWDYLWISDIPTEDYADFFELLGCIEIENLSEKDRLISQSLNSILVLSQRISALGLEPEILSKLPELEYFDSPFIVQNKSVFDYVDQFQNIEDFDKSDQNTDFKHLMVMLSQCEEYLLLIRKDKKKFGTDLHLSYMLLRLSQNIDRLKSLLKLVTKSKDKSNFQGEIELLKILVKAVNRKNSLGDHIEQNVNLLAFQITEHAGKTGEHYIANSSKEWWDMLVSSMGGGFIVGFLSVIKVLIYYLRLPLFGETFLYSMNYSIGFIGIHLTHSTLATKQPAMTASKLAAALDEVEKPKSVALGNLAEFVVKIFRSQFIAFVGNVIVAFPVAFLIAYGYHYFSGSHIAGQEKAFKLISEMNPINSLALFHAGITGVFLFLSGMISGYYDNKNVYNQIPKRIKNHKGLIRVFGQKRTDSLSDYLDNNLGSLAGNFFLGVFLGSLGSLGIIFGLPLDVQHITFASGNFGLAFVSVGEQLTLNEVLLTVSGIFGIGVMNFLVSFSLAIFVAIKSRNVTFKQSKKLFGILMLRFLKSPHHFFLPIYDNVSLKENKSNKEKDDRVSINDKNPESGERKVRPIKK
ncbi:site-specific recombinase [Aquiflexum gelatinilyticum]|uniref:site-specific recombinase n=1 Tax=Aquiflexum gelatinilyticum TaxID=2961943 RepID=UPI002166E7F2|nr:site-specific recombinase [Aquiflexum gelatinilyticum]MCS4432884.1 site-specific recombinase [Aquiflexum gelatinilyticum]